METVVIVVLALYAAVMTYLRASAAKTATKLDDKALEYGEKIEPVVDLIKGSTGKKVVPKK